MKKYKWWPALFLISILSEIQIAHATDTGVDGGIVTISSLTVTGPVFMSSVTATSATISNLSANTATNTTATIATLNVSSAAVSSLTVTTSLWVSSITFSDGTSMITVPKGKLLQIVQGTQNGLTTTTSTSFTDTGTTVSITPSTTTSKILVMATGSLGTSENRNGVAYATLTRDSTVLGSASTGMQTVDAGPATGFQLRVPAAMSYLDSPSTTSSTTYKVQIKTNNASYTTTWGLGIESIIAMEIAQ